MNIWHMQQSVLTAIVGNAELPGQAAPRIVHKSHFCKVKLEEQLVLVESTRVYIPVYAHILENPSLIGLQIGPAYNALINA